MVPNRFYLGILEENVRAVPTSGESCLIHIVFHRFILSVMIAATRIILLFFEVLNVPLVMRYP